MRLYTLTGATQVDDPQYGKFTAGPDGAFDFPNEMSDKMHGFHVGGAQAWETDAERTKRLEVEELERLRDPATLATLIQSMAQSRRDATHAPARTEVSVEAKAPAKPAPEAVAKTEPAKPKVTRARGKGTTAGE